MKKTRWQKEYWTGFFVDGPHQTSVTTDDGEFYMPELFIRKRDALKYFDEVVKVKLVEVKA